MLTAPSGPGPTRAPRSPRNEAPPQGLSLAAQSVPSSYRNAPETVRPLPLGRDGTPRSHVSPSMNPLQNPNADAHQTPPRQARRSVPAALLQPGHGRGPAVRHGPRPAGRDRARLAPQGLRQLRQGGGSPAAARRYHMEDAAAPARAPPALHRARVPVPPRGQHGLPDPRVRRPRASGGGDPEGHRRGGQAADRGPVRRLQRAREMGRRHRPRRLDRPRPGPRPQEAAWPS